MAEAWDVLVRQRLRPGRAHQERHIRGFDPRDGATMWIHSSLASGAAWLPGRDVAVPRYTVTWLLAGSLSYRDAAGEVRIDSGDAFQRFPGHRHSVSVDDPGRIAFWSASLPPGALEVLRGSAIPAASAPVVRVGRDAGLLRRALDLHDRIGAASTPLAAGRAAAECLALVVDLVGGAAREVSPEERAAALLAAELRRAPSLDRIARAVGLSPSRLRHRFAERFGLPPAAWHRRERLRHVHRLLAAGGTTVDAAARASGWSDGRALAKAFRAAFGYPPAACRVSG